MSDSQHPDEQPIARPAPAPKQQTATSGPLPAAEGKKKKPETPPQMKLINLLVIGFLAYGVVNYMAGDVLKLASPSSGEKSSESASAPSPSLHPEDPRIDRLLAQDTFNTLGKVFPKLRANVGTVTLKAGDGRAVYCGQTVTYRLHETGKASTEKTITLGREHSKEADGLTWGLEGARIGEWREIQIPEDYNVNPFSDVKPQVTKRVVEILAATPLLPKMGEMPLRRFMLRGGAGYDLRCGDQAVAHLTLWNSAGKMLFSSLGGLPVYFEIGAGKSLPYGIEIAAKEMGPGGAYTLILPAELLKPLHPGESQPSPPKTLAAQPFPASVKLPETGILIVDLDFVQELPLKNTPQDAEKPLH